VTNFFNLSLCCERSITHDNFSTTDSKSSYAIIFYLIQITVFHSSGMCKVILEVLGSTIYIRQGQVMTIQAAMNFQSSNFFITDKQIYY